MAQWAKVSFYYDTMLGSIGSTLAADSTDTGGDYSVDYIHNMLETNRWMSNDSASPQHITYDAGTGEAKEADYLAILGHNLGTIGATVVLQYSSDGFTADVNDAFTAEGPTSDTVFFKEFASPGPRRYWRLVITGASARPVIAVCVWGRATELDYATSSFDPHGEDARATVNISGGGYVAGVHSRYTEREMTLRFASADPVLYDKLRAWRETSGLRNFFVAWERANHPGDVFLVRPDTRFVNPLASGGLYRDVTVRLTGRKE